MLTDGVDTFSRMSNVERTFATIGESHVPVYVVRSSASRDDTSTFNAADLGPEAAAGLSACRAGAAHAGPAGSSRTEESSRRTAGATGRS